MTTAEAAFLISGMSGGIALFGLGWNIYRDIVLKPKVRVRLQVSEIITPGVPKEKPPTKVVFIATNFGPGKVTLQGIKAKTKKFLKKTKWGFLMHDYTDSLSKSFPHKLDVGEEAMFCFPFRKQLFLKSNFTKIGIWDSFGHTHWVPKEEIKRAKKTYHDQFGGDENGSDGEINNGKQKNK